MMTCWVLWTYRLMVFMYTHRNIFTNTEEKTKINKQRQQIHYKLEGEKEVNRYGWQLREAGVGWSLSEYSCTYPCSYLVIHTEP